MTWVALLGAAWLAWVGLLVLAQRRILFPGGVLDADRPSADRVAGLERLRLPLPDGDVEAWFIRPVADAPAPALLFMHGNGELVDDWVHDLADFAVQGVGVMLVEYPGYGRSAGRASAASIARAVRDAYDTLALHPAVDPARIVAYGRSVGGGPAARLSEERPLAALVLTSTFTSLAPFARRMGVPGFLLRDRFEVLRAVEAYRGPVLVTHGRRDDIVPFSHGERLGAAGPNVTFVPYDCAHNDCPPSWPGHVATVLAFLVRAGVAR